MIQGFDYSNESEVTICLPIENDYSNSRCRNIITVELDKMSECGTNYDEESDPYNLFHHYVLCDNIGFDQKLLSIRVPGGSVGYIEFNDNNIITNVHVDSNYVIKHYWRNVNKHLKKYIGRQLTKKRKKRNKMIELEGKYNKAKIFTDVVDNATLSQIQCLLNQEFMKDSVIRIMPDCHAGKGCTIGTVIKFIDKMSASLTGVDLSCGMHVVYLGKVNINFEELDKVIRTYIPSGFSIHERSNYNNPDLESLYADVDLDRAKRSIGTLGGGNHFIEIDIDKNDNYYLIIHSGSRYLGLQVCKFYQDLAWERLKDKAAGGSLKEQTKRLIEFYKDQHKTKELNKAIKELKEKYKLAHPEVPYELAYLEGVDLDKYLCDIFILNQYAKDNREAIGNKICKEMKWKPLDMFHTIHNYIDPNERIVRKGSISAKKDELAVIPLNMRDGTLLVSGKGNNDWLNSAPHGAGRIMSRNEAKNSISMKDYKESMEGIYTTCINNDTIDESCFAYKNKDDIIANIQDTVEILDVLKPVYNFKAGGE